MTESLKRNDRLKKESLRTIEVNSLVISDAVYGVGKTHLLALHGWTKDGKETILPSVKHLPYDKYTVHVPDLPGFGLSQIPQNSWSLENYCDFLISYLNRQNYNDSVNIMGHSFGGRIALKLAAEYPNVVNKMVLIDSAGISGKISHKDKIRTTSYKLTRSLLENANMNVAANKLREWYNGRFSSEDYKNSEGVMRSTFLKVVNEDARIYASSVKCPTLILWGSNDLETPVWQGKELQKLIPNSGLFVWQGAGHYSHLERPDGTCRAIDLFLDQK